MSYNPPSDEILRLNLTFKKKTAPETQEQPSYDPNIILFYQLNTSLYKLIKRSTF